MKQSAEWIYAKDRQPKEDGFYVVAFWPRCHEEHPDITTMIWDGGWNCYRDVSGTVHRDYDMGERVMAWFKPPAPPKPPKRPEKEQTG